MWIFTNQGFVSIVKQGEQYAVRARAKTHLENLFPHGKIIETMHSDYQFRVMINREELIVFMMNLAISIDYSNFKGSVDDARYSNWLSEVWLHGWRYQSEGSRSRFSMDWDAEEIARPSRLRDDSEGS